jgi:hypothetical protein
MITIEVKCDRCKKWIIGGYDDHPIYGYTAGYYIKSSWWGKFMNGNERTLCDNCMMSDPEYIKVYGTRTAS